MLWIFPPGTVARVVRAYAAPYPDPIALRAGDLVHPDPSRSTEIVGWIWCRGPDGREGWVPEAWLDDTSDGPRIRRDFAALELTVSPGERIALELAESGFVLGRDANGARGWLPDGVLALDES